MNPQIKTPSSSPDTISNSIDDWLDGYHSAVSLTFDDGMNCHLDIAIPILEAYGLRGTFYPIAEDDSVGESEILPSLEKFQPVASNKHEVGNHSIHHWCSCSANFNSNQIGLEYLTLDQVANELDQSIIRHKVAFPQTTLSSFCYPCYNTFVGRGLERRSYVPLVAERFFAARGGGEMSNLINSPYHADLHCLTSWKCENQTASNLIDLLALTKETKGGWNIFTFHGVGEGRLPIETIEFEALCRFLQKEQTAILTAPLIQVAQKLQQWRQKTAYDS